jgi:signal transduction histidine kinase
MPDTEQNPELEHLQQVIADYEAQLKELTEMVARVRHEINNPLTGVLGQAQLLLRENLADSTRQRVETIERLALRIRDTVTQLRETKPVENASPKK